MEKKMSDKELGAAVLSRVACWEEGGQIQDGLAQSILETVQGSYCADDKTFGADAAYMPAFVAACGFLGKNLNPYQREADTLVRAIFRARVDGAFADDCYEAARQYVADSMGKPSREATIAHMNSRNFQLRRGMSLYRPARL